MPGITGHAECIQIEYDDTLIKYATLLEVFFDTHDPTTLNRQGADVGTQYRSAIFYHDKQQLQTAKDIKNAIVDKFDNPIVTELTPFIFYEAELEQHDYYNLNPSQPYCEAIISPKVKKFLTSYSKLQKKNYDI